MAGLKHKKSPQHSKKRSLSANVIAPVLVGILALVVWDVFVRVTGIPPYLQTTPIVAIAPLIIIWLKNNTFAALIVCA